MNNVMTFEDGYKAVIAYDPEIEMFRGEFVGLNGAADFYAADLEGLKREGKTSLEVFLEVCAEKGISPKKQAGRFALRLDSETYQSVAIAASASGKSINQFIVDSLKQSVPCGSPGRQFERDRHVRRYPSWRNSPGRIYGPARLERECSCRYLRHPQKYWQIRLTREHLCEELKKSPCPGEDRGGVLFRRTMGVEILPNEEA